MKADTNIVDTRTGEIIAWAGQHLDDETLYRMERCAIDAHYDALQDEVWREMEAGLISPVNAELRIARLMRQAGWRQVGSIAYRV